jgi:hypothetical protein
MAKGEGQNGKPFAICHLRLAICPLELPYGGAGIVK